MAPQPLPHPRGRADRAPIDGRCRRGHRGRQGDVHRADRGRCARRSPRSPRPAGPTAWPIDIVAGPNEYLYGEETGLLEVVDGRPPFPRIAPPYRHGAEEVGEGRISAAHVAMAGEAGAPPTLANNVETMANVALILANGAEWFREYGTADSPGTIVCTITGVDAARPASARSPMGTTLREVITEHRRRSRAGRPHPRRAARRVEHVHPRRQARHPAHLRGHARRRVRASARAASSCSTSATTWWPSPRASPGSSPSSRAASARRASRTAWRSPTCCSSSASPTPPRPTLDELASRIDTVADEARCNLATQQQLVVGSLLALFPGDLARHLETSTASGRRR